MRPTERLAALRREATAQKLELRRLKAEADAVASKLVAGRQRLRDLIAEVRAEEARAEVVRERFTVVRAEQ